MIKKIFLCITFLSSSSAWADLLIGDSTQPSKTFTFNVGPHAFFIPRGRLFVAAAEPVKNNRFSVASIFRDSTTFEGLTPELVTLNGEPETKNPLCGAAIKHLALLGARPAVSATKMPSLLFLLDIQNQLHQSTPIKNALGSVISSVHALTTSAADIFEPLDVSAELAAFAAVGNQNDGFDGDGSGIALLFFKKFTTKEKKTFFAWDAVNASTGESQYTNDGQLTQSGNRAFPFGKTTPELFINSPVSSLSNIVDLHFDRELGKLYIALQVTGGPGQEDGARAIVAGSILNGKLSLQPIAPADTFSRGNTGLVGGTGSNASVAVHKVRTLQTRTYLRYLVFVGGNGTGEQLKQEVWALPLVDNLRSPFHGALARVQSPPINLFAGDPPHRFLTRVFNTPARKPKHLYTAQSVQARVGGDAQLPGPITDIKVSGEAVFVSIGQNGNGLEAGIFQSQPFFDEEGRINGWTPWQRVAGTGERIAGFNYDPLVGNFSIIRLIKTDKGDSTTSLFRTSWTDGKDELGTFISKELPQPSGGAQGLFDFPFTTSSLSQEPGKRISFQAYTGFKKIVLLQTGKDSFSCFGPHLKTTELYTNNDGILNDFKSSAALSLSGGALDSIGPISSCTVVTDGTFGWLVVGGSSGVAILADQNGRGWNAQTGLESGFKGITSAMSWQKISTKKNVRKLVAVDNRLFILTNRKLVRQEITASQIVNRTIKPAVIAQLDTEGKEQSHSFSDLIISGKLGLLATSIGLLRSGDFVDIQTVSESKFVGWTVVDLPETVGSLTAPGPISRFFTVSSAGIDSATPPDGNIYALNAYVGLGQALVYRLVLTPGPVTEKTIRLFPDFFVRGKPTFFTNLGDYRNYFVTDGAFLAVSRSAFRGASPLLEMLRPQLKSGEINGARSRVPFVFIQDPASSIGKLIRNSASGSWTVPGDFGVRFQA